jgi:lipopolysaccharide export LptBFGC system permease protein LptF
MRMLAIAAVSAVILLSPVAQAQRSDNSTLGNAVRNLDNMMNNRQNGTNYNNGPNYSGSSTPYETSRGRMVFHSQQDVLSEQQRLNNIQNELNNAQQQLNNEWREFEQAKQAYQSGNR